MDKIPQYIRDEWKKFVRPKVGDRVIVWGHKGTVTIADECKFTVKCDEPNIGYGNVGFYEGGNWRFIKIIPKWRQVLSALSNLN